MNISIRQQSLIALFYFFISASLGVTLRLFAIVEIPITYKFFLHTHSHVALLGWVYTAFIAIIYKVYLSHVEKRKFLPVFLLTQSSIIGMLFSFPFQGYALYSIFFSTLFLISSYFFLHFFLKHAKKDKSHLLSFKFIKTSLWFMVFSSIGPWSLGIIMNTLGNTSIWYKLSIYFYLHFQYNGWFITALFGLFFFLLEKEKILINKIKANYFYRLQITSVLFTFFLSTLWAKPPFIIYILALLGIGIQLIGFYQFILILSNSKIRENLTQKSTFLGNLLKVIFLFYILKIILQTLSGIPYFSNLAYHFIDFVIGYIHLIFIGIISIALFAFLHYLKIIFIPKKGYYLFLLGFILSEFFIFLKGISSWLVFTLPKEYLSYLTLISALMPLGILYIIFINLIKKLKNVTKKNL